MRRRMASSMVGAALVCVLLGNPPTARAADCNGNGVHDAVDILDGTSPDCNRNGVPDECDFQQRGFRLVPGPEVAANARAIAAADLDRDGHPDLIGLEAVAETQRVVSFLGK